MQADDLEIVDGAAVGAWIKPGLGGKFGAVMLQIPKGFGAYARIFHPARESDWNPVTWAKVADYCGTVAHREMQWHAIVGLSRYEDLQNSKWPGNEPSTGAMDTSTLDALCQVLAAHTEDQAHCFFGLCTIQSWEDSFSKDELRGHPLLELPWDRNHIVLKGPLSAVDQIVEEFKTRSSPNLIWPADHSWLVASEVDFDSTLVGGDRDLIDSIVASPELEAWQVEPTDSLAVDADKVNVVLPDGGDQDRIGE